MDKKGFISSSLLYGILALFLILMLSTLAILGNRKLSMDKLKEHALTTVETGYASSGNILAIYDGFQKPTDNNWPDQSGNGYNALLYNLSETDHSLDHLNINSNSYIDTGFSQGVLGQNITLSTVMKITHLSEGQGLWGYYDENQAGLMAEAIKIGNNLAVKFCYYGTDKNQVCTNINADQLLNKKIQITVVIQGNQGIYLYINGISRDSETNTSSFSPKTDYSFVIGQASGGANHSFTGELYNFVIYKGALNEEEILQNYEVDNEKYSLDYISS